ncbi:THO complex subunit 1 [Elysia marginata]|uniref:THO complex subunit 1 n=1 Tax=Elysia marginata TaxID=1093978 RepID=A0AAV4IL86_9GAST|nr:THO complex subunit 1 [Elysia marginata]
MAAPSETSLEFDNARRQFKVALKKSVEANDKEDVLAFVEKYEDELGLEKRAVLDQVFRDILCEMISNATEAEHLKNLINFAVQAVQQDMCSPSTPFLMMADIFDMLTIERCEDIFDLVEDKVTTWKSETFYESGKNYLLRMCNDLIRRLSKSQNTIFCGRIQLFLSRLFPLSEKSALNLASQFNLENVTIFTKKEDSEEKESTADVMEVDTVSDQTSSIPIDYHLYSKFWALQDFFRRPTQCYDKSAWDVFARYAKDVLAIFSSYKLDDTSSSSSKKVVPTQQQSQQQAQNFFAKYLTSEKLLNLQLNDSNFRRYVLVQFLIIFQYLKATVKFKTQVHTLSDEQTEWLKDSQQEVTKLLCETPPHGEQFCTSVKHILEREEHWNNWKNESCPSFIKEKSKEQVKAKPRPKRKRIGDDLMASGGKSLKLGHPELTRLWNLNPDNMDACKDESRVFLPKLDDFFANAIDQADPEAMVEEQYKDINHQNFQWKAYRLLARSSPHFFVHAVTPGLPINAHLKDIVDKMAKELNPNQGTDEVKSEVAVAEDDDEIKENNDEEEEIKNGDQEETPSTQAQFNAEEMQTLAEKLGDSWMKLGEKLDFPADDLAYFKDSNDSPTSAALAMLTVWQEVDPDRDTKTIVRDALKEIGLTSILKTFDSL